VRASWRKPRERAKNERGEKLRRQKKREELKPPESRRKWPAGQKVAEWRATRRK